MASCRHLLPQTQMRARGRSGYLNISKIWWCLKLRPSNSLVAQVDNPSILLKKNKFNVRKVFCRVLVGSHMGVSMDENGGAFNSWILVMFPGVSHSLHGFLGVTYLASTAPIQGIPLVARIWLHPKAMAKEKATSKRFCWIRLRKSSRSRQKKAIFLNPKITEGHKKKKHIFTKPTKERKAARYAT